MLSTSTSGNQQYVAAQYAFYLRVRPQIQMEVFRKKGATAQQYVVNLLYVAHVPGVLEYTVRSN